MNGAEVWPGLMGEVHTSRHSTAQQVERVVVSQVSLFGWQHASSVIDVLTLAHQAWLVRPHCTQ